MSSLIKSLALLIAIVGLAVISQASLVNGELRNNISGSLSELGNYDNLDWVKILRRECKANDCSPDKAFELLKTLDKIYAALDEDARANRNEQKIVEQFEINQISSDQFCARENLEQLTELSACYHRTFLRYSDPTWIDELRLTGNFLHERGNNFAFLCRSYALKKLDNKVGEMNEMYRHDMETRLGNKLVLLRDSGESLNQLVDQRKFKLELIYKISPKWMDALLEFLKEKSGNNLDANCYISTGDEGRQKFDQLFEESVVQMCWRWINAIEEAETFRDRDRGQKEDYTEKQASWIKYAYSCRDITSHRKSLVEAMYVKMGGKSSEIQPVESAKKKVFKAWFKKLLD